jgi:cell division inhibitor SepF
VPSLLKKTMVYLGLLDDEYDDYEDDYEDRSPKGYTPIARPEQHVEPEEPPARPTAAPATSGRIRPIPRENNGRTVTPTVRPQPLPTAARPAGVSELTPKVVAPARFGDATEIADCLKTNRPVIVNLVAAERDLQRRMIDFCSGVTYALSGEMEKVTDQVFLLAPSNVKVSDEERQRLQERNYGRQ